MEDHEWLAQRFEEQRPRLEAVAYRMLGSTGEAEDAVQDAWLRLTRADPDAVENLAAWLTTVVSRVCLNMLRSRATRREESLEAAHVPDPVVTAEPGADPEQEAVLADSVGLAMLVVLETLAPAERLAFVLHDMFAVPFDDIAGMLEKSPAAVRQLASRARRRVQGSAQPDRDRGRQREVVDAFFAAARDGDFDSLVAVLHPDVVLRSDGGAGHPLSVTYHGARTVAGQAITFGRLFPLAHPALINGAAGVVVASRDRVLSVMAFTVADGRIAAIDVLADPERLSDLDLPPLADGTGSDGLGG
ncbi:RNA polymerase sigma factor SigJ [Georgenia subflava]|uniref:Sigma-70 family RNA polymerase sigma factor n=1 Tax=Georgenia subflava TaxID=1622177 RepID=A0A6N7EJQ2_9MICO|nr:RNA polymerase sigma factor SigJ [Georgenia subflava]MPV36426.1 sigma-70 family RNA polymerase sigma factor [Georgenia subflava]